MSCFFPVFHDHEHHKEGAILGPLIERYGASLHPSNVRHRVGRWWRERLRGGDREHVPTVSVQLNPKRIRGVR